MPFASRLAAVAAAAVVLGSAVIPGPPGEPARRLLNVDADGRDPRWDRPLDGTSVRRAGSIVPDDSTYLLDVRGADPVLQGNLKAAAQLFLAPALPVQSEANADWVLRLRAGRVVVSPR